MRAALLILASLATVSAAQTRTYAPITATEDLRLEIKRNGLRNITNIAVAPDGRIITGGEYGSTVTAFDSLGKRTKLALAIGGREAEISWPQGYGFHGSTMYVIDPGFRHFALVDANGKVTKSLEFPEWIKPAWADRRKFPVFERMDALALYPDHSMLVVPRNTMAPLETPEYDPKSSYIVRISETGTIQKTIAKIPNANARPAGPQATASPTGVLYSAPTDGSRVGIVAFRGPDVGKDSIRVTMIGEKGDTIYNKRFAYAKGDVPKRVLDSLTARLTARRLTPKQTDSVRKDFIAHYAAPNGFRVGRDGSAWIAFKEYATGRARLVLDPRGEPLGLVMTPPNFSLFEGDRDHMWGIEMEGRNPFAIVRYKIKR